MRDRRKHDVVSWSRFFWFTTVVVVSCVLFTGFFFSTFRLFFRDTFRPVLGSTLQTSTVNAVVSNELAAVPVLSVRETVFFPDQVILFLKYPPSARLFTREELFCVCLSADHSSSTKQPARVDNERPGEQIVRCPTCPRGMTVTVGSKSNGIIPAGPTNWWDSLAYEALLDKDDTTVVFVKGLNLRPERVYDASRFECVYGWDFRKFSMLLRSEVLSIAQEIVRCKTPQSILNSQRKVNGSIKVSVRVKGSVTLLPSIARLRHLVNPGQNRVPTRNHEMCICTMARNQARFLEEWVMYHARIGVQRWFIYDNNSDDDTESVIDSLSDLNYNISRHFWPWIKTQEAGFAHCGLRARDSCDWVGFIDVDEFFHLPLGLMIHDVLVLKNLTSKLDSSLDTHHQVFEDIPIGEMRIPCYSFGPSGLKRVPIQGITVGYTCRLTAPERHKSIVKPEALNSTLINVVHHFHLKEGFRYVDVERAQMVVNHYKYQVWEVFKEKFYRRVATYVADWQDDQNVGSKDRTPGLGTKAFEPVDWSSRFCEVLDTGLRNRVLRNFVNPRTSRLPWQDANDAIVDLSLVDKNNKSRKHKRRNRVPQ